MNALKTGALALTLIIAIPILLGFGMAGETVEKEVLQESETVNLSDAVLNSTTDYYMSYSGPQNNSAFLQKLYNEGGYEYALGIPDYVSTGSTYSSIPTYTSSSATYNLSDVTTVTHSGNASYTVAVGDEESSSSVSVYQNDYVAVTNTLGLLAQYIYYVNGSYGGSDYINTSDSFYFYRSGADTYSMVHGTTTVQNVTSFTLYSDQTPTFTVKYSDATTISIDEPYYVISLGGKASAIINYGDGTTEYVYDSDLESVIYLNSTLYLDGTRYDEVDSYGLSAPSWSSITYYYNSTVSGVYADPSAGWTLPESSATAYYNYWSNGYVNGAVTFDVYFTDVYTRLIMEPRASVTSAADYTLQLDYSSSGVLTATYGGDVYTIGAYDRARIVMDAENEELTIYGLTSWAAIGVAPTTYNSITLSIDREEFSLVYLATYLNGVADTDAVALRVDSARIVAGEFPSTEDYSLVVTYLYPDVEHYSVYINSIGIYGDEVTVAGNTIESPLKKTIKVDFDEDGYWTIEVDGETYFSVSPPAIYFDGEWSLTLTCTTYEYATVTETEWTPGEFAFDKDDFILCMIIASVGVFVALGLYKGTRVGVLAVVCAVAGIIAFVIA